MPLFSEAAGPAFDAAQIGADVASSASSAAPSFTDTAMAGASSAFGTGANYLGDLFERSANWVGANPGAALMGAGIGASALTPGPKMPKMPEFNFGSSTPASTSTAAAPAATPGSRISPLLQEKQPQVQQSMGLQIPDDEQKRAGGFGIV